MRIATLIIGLMLTVGLFIQSLTVAALSDAVNTKDDGAEGAIGVMMSVMWLVAVGLVIPLPFISMIVFAVAGVIGLAGGASTEFTDLTIWGIISFALAVMSFFGWRGKKKQQAKEDARDVQLAQSVAAQQQMSAQLYAMQQHQLQMQQQHAYAQPQPTPPWTQPGDPWAVATATSTTKDDQPQSATLGLHAGTQSRQF